MSELEKRYVSLNNYFVSVLGRNNMVLLFFNFSECFEYIWQMKMRNDKAGQENECKYDVNNNVYTFRLSCLKT